MVTSAVMSAAENCSPATKGDSVIGRQDRKGDSRPEACFDRREPEFARNRVGRQSRPFRPAEALRIPSITAAKPSSSARRSHMVTNAFSVGVSPNRGFIGEASSKQRKMARVFCSN
jgi:hypothetical protein